MTELLLVVLAAFPIAWLVIELAESLERLRIRHAGDDRVRREFP